MRTVILREFVLAVGAKTLPYTDRVIDHIVSYDEADRLTRRRLDRRKTYAIIHGHLCEVLSFSESCSGCDEGPEHGGGGERGGGCLECGYTGRRRTSMFMPVDDDDAMHDASPRPLASWEKIDGSPVQDSERRWFPRQSLTPSTALALYQS